MNRGEFVRVEHEGESRLATVEDVRSVEEDGTFTVVLVETGDELELNVSNETEAGWFTV